MSRRLAGPETCLGSRSFATRGRGTSVTILTRSFFGRFAGAWYSCDNQRSSIAVLVLVIAVLEQRNDMSRSCGGLLSIVSSALSGLANAFRSRSVRLCMITLSRRLHKLLRMLGRTCRTRFYRRPAVWTVALALLGRRCSNNERGSVRCRVIVRRRPSRHRCGAETKQVFLIGMVGYHFLRTEEHAAQEAPSLSL